MFFSNEDSDSYDDSYEMDEDIDFDNEDSMDEDTFDDLVSACDQVIGMNAKDDKLKEKNKIENQQTKKSNIVDH